MGQSPLAFLFASTQQTPQGATGARINAAEIRKEDIFTNPLASGA
jgi:hypothetical protein